ncbi:PREDICTED: uncharacterized protein LOC104825717 [Tarenaya hassleriana]|uniref:uncharacterized protein LOC104825717 n=1 Tax=Tarenaya hassleriana TaxID=28532 RepID=UPI00053C605F|nr:PREDICTED: uncharacterized protein LOC104825717 [Tarenaya hassleriana]
MCSSTATTAKNFSIFLPKITPSILQRRFSVHPCCALPRPPRFRAVASLPGISWVSHSSGDGYGGWALVDDDIPHPHRKKVQEFRKIVIGGVGTSLAVLLATVAYFTVSGKGFRLGFRSSLRSLCVDWVRNGSEMSKNSSSPGTDEKNFVCKTSQEDIDKTCDTVSSGSTKKSQPVLVPVAVDATQQEALKILKKLKIIEDDVRADDLCTRREYARWVVRTNLLLERSPKRRIVPAVAIAGSSTPAFDDVSPDDPDFEYIQAIAEAGIISSKLSEEDSQYEMNKAGSICFSPESFVSRLDLINWKSQLECDCHPEIMEEISRTRSDYMDVKHIDPNIALGFFMDMLGGDKSTIRKVFGKIKRFQPSRPATKAQAAVALTSGRMEEAILTELSRVQAETLAKLVEMEEIKSELLEKGDIMRYWEETLQEERARGLEMEEIYLTAVRELEEEELAQQKWFTEHLKEKAAIDCQRQLLHTLREEVDEMSKRLASEKSVYLDEHSQLEEMLSDLKSKHESLLDKRSILEAEVEALRILRSWVEDEARASQARTKVLEEVERRWKWDDPA